MDIWELLGIDATADMSKIKSAYAQEAKRCHPEEEPEAFMALQKAYKAAAAYARKQGQKNDSPEGSFEPGLPCVPDTAAREKNGAAKFTEQHSGLSYDFSILDFYDEKDGFFRQCLLVLYNPFLGNNVTVWELFLSRPSFEKLFQDTVFRKELIHMVCRTHPKPPWKRKTLLFFEEYMKQYHTEANRPEDGIWETQLREFRQAKHRSFWFRTTLKERFITKTGIKFHEMLLSGIKKDKDALDIGNRKDMEDYLQAYLAYADDHEKEVCLLCDREKEEKTTQETDYGIEIPTRFLTVCLTGLFLFILSRLW